MKVVLLRHIRGLGKKGDVVNVSDGYARNSLIPKKIASPATDSLIKQLKQRQKAEEEKMKREEEKIFSFFKLIEGRVIEIEEKANEKGKLYHSFSKKDLIQIIKEKYLIRFPLERLFLRDFSLKEIGDHPITLSFKGKKIEFVFRIKKRDES